MDPFVLGLVAVMGASAAVAARIRRLRRRNDAAPPPTGSAATTSSTARANATARAAAVTDPDAVRVGDVLTHLSDEFWLAGELAVLREGAPVVRVFTAPERGRDRYLALPRDGRSVWVLFANADLAALGWPGVEVPSSGKILRRFEHGSAAIAPSGEIGSSWEGVGRFALFRGLDEVALVLEGPTRERLALVGREIPRQLVQKLG